MALADAITKWAELEDTLALLFAFSIRATLPCAIDLYFTPVATETRFALVDVAMQSLVTNHPEVGRLKASWEKTLGTLNKARKVRNKLAHGAAVEWRIGEASQPRLTGPTLKSVPDPRRVGQFPGMSLHDVKAAYYRFMACVSSVGTISNAVQLHWAAPHDVGTFAEICQQLEEHLRTGSAQLGGPPRLGL